MKKLGLFIAFSLFFALGMAAQTQQDPQKPKKGTPKPTTSVGQKPAPAPATVDQPKNTVPRRRAVLRRKPVQAAPAPAPKQTMQKRQ